MALNFEQLKQRQHELANKLAEPELILDKQEYKGALKEKEQLDGLIALAHDLSQAELALKENKNILATNDEPELVALAEAEKDGLKNRLTQIKQALSKAEAAYKNVQQSGPRYRAIILELRAGAGGEEAALFVADLLRLYHSYAASQNWNFTILDSKPTEIGGFKEVIFQVTGSQAYNKLRFEGGVHRVQRVPTTEKAGRVHTSTASVAALAKPEAKDIKINPQQLRVDTFRASGPGGQYVNKRETAIRITHLPSGLVVSSQTERSLLRNRENAMSILYARLLEAQEQAATAGLDQERRKQIGTADRSEKVRTYNFPQNRLTDHRVKKSWQQLDRIMEGQLDKVIEALQEIKKDS